MGPSDLLLDQLAEEVAWVALDGFAQSQKGGLHKDPPHQGDFAL